MKSKQHKSEQIQAEWLIQQIKELDRLVAMHRTGESHFVAAQYEERRLHYFKELVSLLIDSEYNVTGHETFPLVNALISENYSSSKPAQKTSTQSKRKNAFERTLEFYQNHSFSQIRLPSETQKDALKGNKKNRLIQAEKKVKPSTS